MSCQFSIYSKIIIIIHIFGLYYAFLFCSIYVKSINGWIEGVCINFIIDFCVSGFMIPLLVALLRKTLQAFKPKFEDTN